MDITPLGDSALIVHVRDRFKDAPEKTLNEDLNVRGRLEDAHIPGVIELAAAYTKVASFFDLFRVINHADEPERDIECLKHKIHETLPPGEPNRRKNALARSLDIPRC